MPPNVAELVAGVADLRERRGDRQAGPVAGGVGGPDRRGPEGAMRRLWAFGGLQAQVALAYLAYWVDLVPGRRASRAGAGRGPSPRAIKMLRHPGYLRGAATKLGQALAIPRHRPRPDRRDAREAGFEAPPMRFALLREHVRDELGAERRSVRDVRPAGLRGRVAGPGAPGHSEVGRGATRREDPVSRDRPVDPLGLPQPIGLPPAAPLGARLGTDEGPARGGPRHRAGDRLPARGRMAAARPLLFHEDDLILVPRVYDELSTRRVLTIWSTSTDDIHAFRPAIRPGTAATSAA